MIENIYPGGENEQKPEPGFINNDQASDSSIGSGTSDQGIEPGTEEQEDEFRKEPYSLATDPVMFNLGPTGEKLGEIGEDKPAEKPFPEEEGQGALDKGYGFINQRPTHGLVEEGPGPDA